jgi:uncharacterized membrane protein
MDVAQIIGGIGFYIEVFGVVVVIRTILVFTIHLEVEGRWPWQPAKD